MQNLFEGKTRGNRRSLLALMVGVILLTILASDSIVSEPRTSACLPVDEHTRQVLITALDTALHQHIGTLFSVMLKDSRGQPERAITGATKAIASYRNGLAELERPMC
jgi:hypothetical protein